MKREIQMKLFLTVVGMSFAIATLAIAEPIRQDDVKLGEFQPAFDQAKQKLLQFHQEDHIVTDGHILAGESKDPVTGMTTVYKHNYVSNGRVLFSRVWEAVLEPVTKEQIGYNVTLYDAQGNLLQKREVRNIKDEKTGLWIGQDITFYDRDGQVTGSRKERITWDAKGLLLASKQIKQFNAQGEFTGSQIHTYTYGDNGSTFVNVKSFDPKGNLVSDVDRKDPVPDGRYDIDDLATIARYLGEKSDSKNIFPDVNGDGEVDIFDLVSVARDLDQIW